MKRDARSPAAYRQAVTGPLREMLEIVRTAVFAVAPESEETIAYGMLHYPGICSLAAQKHHVAVYLAPAILAEQSEHFAGVDHGKSCLRFRRPAQVDSAALRRLFRAILTRNARI